MPIYSISIPGLFILILWLSVLIPGIAFTVQKKKGLKIAGKILLLLFTGSTLFGLFIFAAFWMVFTIVHCEGILISMLCFVILFMIWFILRLFSGRRQRPVRYVFLALTLVAGISLSGFAGTYFYKRDRPQVTENKVSAYTPFLGTPAELPGDSSFTFEDNPPTLSGSDAAYPIMASFARATFDPELFYAYKDENGETVEKTPSGSFIHMMNDSSSISDLMNGEVDIVFSECTPEYLDSVELEGMKLKYQKIGTDAFVFFTNRNNPVNDLSLTEIQGIYSGQITKWSEVSGLPLKILAYQRKPESLSQKEMERLMDGIPMADQVREDQYSGWEAERRAMEYKNFVNAISYSWLFTARQAEEDGLVKILAVDGVYPTDENIRNGSYPYTKDIYMVCRENPGQRKQDFFDWALSDEGQYLISACGYVPVTPVQTEK